MLTHAGSGHPGGSLSVIDLLVAIMFGRLRHDPSRPDWPERDRIVLSKGHANASSIKPLDEEMLGRSAAKTGRVVTVEDHSIAGGLGGAVAEWLSEVHPTPLKRIGTTAFGESGDPRGLYTKSGFDPAGVARTVAKFMGR
jgi:transketolase